MLAATQRLRRSADFAAAVRGGRRVGRGTVVVHLSIPSQAPQVRAASQVGPASQASLASQASRASQIIFAEPASAGSSDSPARAGFVVSKAVGNAVVRNEVRRRLRHLVRDRLTSLPAGTMLVVRALPAAAGAPSSVLAADLDAALTVARAGKRARSTGRGAR